MNYHTQRENNTLDTKYLRRAQAARYLSVSMRTLANFQRNRIIPYSKIGKNVLFSINDLDAFVDKFKVNGEG